MTGGNSMASTRVERISGLLQQRRGRDAGRADDALDAERNLVDVAPAPVLAGLERANDRLRGSVVVRGRVALRAVVAAADVTAGEADPRV
jgi:hypothetical protein